MSFDCPMNSLNSSIGTFSTTVSLIGLIGALVLEGVVG
jgi:hypothetical protein